MTNRFSDVPWFFNIKRARLAFADCTETAMTRADVATQHKSRSPVRPALEDVWTTGLLTDSVQVQPLDQFQDIVLIGGIAKPNLQPFRFGLALPRRVADNV